MGSCVILTVPSIKDTCGAGGVAVRWNEYVNELHMNGWDVEVWSVDSDDPMHRLERIVMPFSVNTLTDLPTVEYASRLFHRLTSAKPKVKALISTDLFTNITTALCCRAAGVPFIFSIHTDIGQLKCCPLPLANFVQNITITLASDVITTSKSFCETLEKRGVRGVKKYYRPLPVDFTFPTGNEVFDARLEMTCGNPARKVFLYAGRWSMEKRIELLKNAIPRDSTLCLIGDGPLGDEIASWHNGEHVVVLRGMKKRSELVKYYASSDWIVSASAFETFGNVPYEAAHLGTPAILQNAQGFVDQIDDKETRGSLVNFELGTIEDAISRTEWLLKRPDVVIETAKKQSKIGTSISDELLLVKSLEPVYMYKYAAIVFAAVFQLFLLFVNRFYFSKSTNYLRFKN